MQTIETGYVLSLCFVPGDRHLLIGLKSGALLIADIAAGDVLEEIPAHSKELWSITLLPNMVSISYNLFNAMCISKFLL